jgi:hypothetical protein
MPRFISLSVDRALWNRLFVSFERKIPNPSVFADWNFRHSLKLSRRPPLTVSPIAAFFIWPATFSTVMNGAMFMRKHSRSVNVRKKAAQICLRSLHRNFTQTS